LTDRGRPPERPAAVTARNLEVRYARGGAPAVTGVDLDLDPGKVLLVTGPAGSGKTSVLHGLLGLAPATGAIAVLGRPPGDPDALRRTGLAPQGRPVDPRLTAREVAALVATLRRAPAGAIDESLAEVGLSAPQRPAGRLDPEEMRRLTLALARIGNPDILVLDDPWEMPETLETVVSARERGAAVILASAEPGSMARLADATLRLVEGHPA
jgi:ABC-2 type transport system ATP-binding protein